MAKVFRHVLMQGDRQLIRVSQEMDLLRTYLRIEEVRFGDRLRARMEIDPSVSRENIPSLILQPVVENANKHGLAPKIGVGNLRIVADWQGDFVRLAVEDDGLGSRGAWWQWPDRGEWSWAEDHCGTASRPIRRPGHPQL